MIVRLLGGIPGLAVRKCSKGKFEFIEDMAAAVNHQVLEVLKKVPTLPFNVLSTDYVHDDIIDCIVKFNDTLNSQQRSLAASPADGAGNAPENADSNQIYQQTAQKPVEVWETNV